MNLLSVAVLCVASITFSVGVYHLMLHARMKSGRLNMAFALLCLAVAAYDVAAACLYSSADLSSGAQFQRWQFGLIALVAIASLWFVLEFTSRKFRLFEKLFVLYFIVQVAVIAFSQSGLVLTAEPAVKVFRFAGMPEFKCYEVEPGLLVVIQGAVGLALSAYILWVLLSYCRSGYRKEALPILIGMGLLVLGVINDSLVGWGIYQSIYLVEFAYLCLVFSMGYSLNSNHVRMSADLQKTSEELKQLGAAVNAAAESIVITDPKGIIEYVNPAFEEMTGYSAEEVIGRGSDVVSSGKHDEEFYSGMWKAISNAETWRGHFQNRKKDGTLFQEDAVISPVLDGNGNIVNYVAVKRDVSQEISLERQLRHSQKMEALGLLASGVAHDITNMLATIIGHTQLAKAQMRPDEDILEHIDVIEGSTARMSSLTADLLAFAHQKPLTLKVVDINRTIKGMKELLERSIDNGVDLEIHSAQGKIMAEADASLLEQVMVHLVVNAVDAMPDGGKISIETSKIKLTQKEAIQFQDHIRETDRLNGDYLLISLSDTGCGMTEEVCSHIFEPFYSTKGSGRSTGLGLSTAYGIVAQHNGHMAVYSHPGHGTTFNIFIPVKEHLDPQGTVTSVSDYNAGGLNILLAEDNPIARKTAVRMLQMLGCKVIEAVDSAQALKLYDENPDIDLLFSDIMMAEMGGIKLAEEVRKKDPAIKVILASGYPKKHLMNLDIGMDGDVFVQKPLTVGCVMSAMEEAMSR